MKVSWKLLNQIIDLHDIEFATFTNKLTLAGFEVEQIDHKHKINDTIIDISITTNRSDVLSLIGLAREIGTLFNKELYNNAIKFESINDDINDNNKFKNISYIQSISDVNIDIIENITNKESPTWIQNYLIGYDIKPSNTIEDIKQYIYIKWGQNIEIFDLDIMKVQKIDYSLFNIDKSNNFENIIKINETNETIDNNLLYVLNYHHLPLSVLGIKSNKTFHPNKNTSSIVIFSHTCQPKYIQKINNFLKIKTEKSIKNARYDFTNAYNEAIQLIVNITQAHITKTYKKTAPFTKKKVIIINKKEIDTILGPINNPKKRYLSEQEILNTLKRLQFISSCKNNNFRVTIPMYRADDITRSIDIIEEIARIYGFNYFIDYLPNKFNNKDKPAVSILIRKIRTVLRNMGLHEVIHYSLNNKKNYNHNAIKIYNPLLEDQSQLRINLLSNLISTKQYNIKQQNLLIEAFEIGKVFKYDQFKMNKNHITENLHLAGILGNTNYIKNSWSDTSKELSWFQAKGNLEEFFEKINACIKWSSLDSNEYAKNSTYKLFHPKRIAIIYDKKTSKKIGIFGQLDLKLAKQLQINNLTYIFEIDIYKLLKTIDTIYHLNYITKKYSHYPSVTRDISFILKKHNNAELIKEKIIGMNNSLIESIEFFNEYVETLKPHIEHSICFRITYRAKDRTLNDQDIKKIDDEINKLQY